MASPPSGQRSDIENVNIERPQAFYKRYYQPDNAVLLIAGKFDRRVPLGWVAESFGAIVRPSRVLPALYTAEPTRDGERDVTVRRVGDIKIAAVGYRVPVRLHADSLALSLLGGDLDQQSVRAAVQDLRGEQEGDPDRTAGPRWCRCRLRGIRAGG